MPKCLEKDSIVKHNCFNFPTETKAIYCNKKCIEERCQKQSNYNLATEKKAIYCNFHKRENMINVKRKKCFEDKCLKQPYYNFATETKAIYCFSHKKENMIDVKSKYQVIILQLKPNQFIVLLIKKKI